MAGLHWSRLDRIALIERRLWSLSPKVLKSKFVSRHPACINVNQVSGRSIGSASIIAAG
jgi:hypothetical protein